MRRNPRVVAAASPPALGLVAEAGMKEGGPRPCWARRGWWHRHPRDVLPGVYGPRPAAAHRRRLRPGGDVGELEERSCPLAQALRPGAAAGDHVAVLLPNDHRTHEVTSGRSAPACLHDAGNTHLAAEEAAYIVTDCGARTLITSSPWQPLAAGWSALTPEVGCG